MNPNALLSLNNKSFQNCTANNDVQLFINLTTYISDV